LERRTAIVTGAARGIGRTIALRLAREGAKVACSDVLEKELGETVAEVESLGGKAAAIRCDVSNGEEAAELVRRCGELLGGPDILVNNAGITRDRLMIQMKDDDWDRVLAINLKGAFNTTKSATRVMMKSGWGRVVNMASIIGLVGNAGQANYAASKGGLIALTKTTAKEFAKKGITANAVAPGFIDTPMTQALKQEYRDLMLKEIPLGRFGTPEDVAGAVAFLAGESASYITGQVIVVDGGMVMG
jgi:3-oxoacyl-[acyl-carrier protein] reductase